MFLASPSLRACLILGYLLALVVSTPVIGIQKDFLKDNDSQYHVSESFPANLNVRDSVLQCTSMISCK